MPLTRSQQMSRIRGRDTKPEIILRKSLWAQGLRYSTHSVVEGCRPDVLIRKSRVAVFVNGCFWHGCPRHYVRPRSRTEFWSAKLLATFERDNRQTIRLERLGWRVVHLWEHEVFESLDRCTTAIAALSSGQRVRRRVAWRVVSACELAAGSMTERWVMRELRHPSLVRVRERVRTTVKWKVPVTCP